MPWTSALIAILLAAGAADDATLGLVRSAWYWQARARSDKAEDAWKQVLEAAPENADALAALGGFAARAGRLDDARGLLARLEKISPAHPDVPVLRRELQLGPRYAPLLTQARKLVHEGRAAEGAAKYRELFGEAGPPGDLALEYYQSIGGTPSGVAEAREGLRKLTRRAPGEARFRLALAKLLTYREETRREGIEMLTGLARDPGVGREAEESWRQALLWLSPGDRDLPLLHAWQKAHPRDTEIARHIEEARHSGTVRDGFAALDRGDLKTAELLFRSAGEHPDARRGLALIQARRTAEMKKAAFAALQRGDLLAAQQLFRGAGDDPDTRLGLALVAQKEALAALAQQDYPRARTLLEESRKLAPERRDVWDEPLKSVLFWGLMREAEEARANGRNAEAEARLLEAEAKAPPSTRWNAELALANLYLSRNQPRDAERRLRDVLSAVPDQPEALRALAVILVQEQRYEEALPVNDRLARVAPSQAFRGGWLRAEMLRQTASRSGIAHDFASARAQLLQARDADPTDIWVLHDLANVLLQLNAAQEAQPVVAELVRLAPDLPEARTTQARLLLAEGRDAEALQLIDSVGSRDPAVVALRRRLEVQVQVPALLALAASGQRAQATDQLDALERKAGGDPALAARIALAWSRLGDRRRAVDLMRRAMSKAPTATRGARLELAAALLQSGEDAQTAQILAGLERDKALSPQERRSLGELRVALAVRRADALRAQGDAQGAISALQPALKAYPQDPRLLGAEARAMEPVDSARAHALYLEVLRAAPGDLDALRGAADTGGNLDSARELSAEAVRLHPADPLAWELFGRVAERSGDDAGAMRAWSRALEITPAATGSGLQPSVSSAAFVEGAPRLAAAGPDPLRHLIERDMQRVRDRYRPGLSGTFEARQRSGEAGLSALTELRQSIEAQAPLGYGARASLRISEVELGTGALGSSAATRYGSGSGDPPGSAGIYGTELRVGYEGPLLSADFGTSPLGFAIFSLQGGARLHGTAGPVSLGIGASRRSVFDSVLSWAGATDPAKGLHWGGVIVDSGRVDLGVTLGTVGLHAWGEGGRLIGVRVADNLRGSGGASADLLVYDGGAGQIRLGPTAAALGYQRNLRFFTLGHGGYFSPQRFVHGGFALRWRREGDIRWDLAAEPGYDYYQEAHEAVFPLAPDGRFYPGRDSGGASFNGTGFVGLGVSRDFEVGLTAAVQQAPQFQEVRAGLALRFGPH